MRSSAILSCNMASRISTFVSFLLFTYGAQDVLGTKLKEGDSCILKSGANGLCKFLTQCTPALANLNEGLENVCSTEGTQVVVCCEDTSEVTQRPSSTSAPTTEIPSPEVVTAVISSNRELGKISREKCEEYSKYVWDRSQSPTLSYGGHHANTFECPFEKLALIVGGTLASRQEFPHMAVIGYAGEDRVEWSCGGSLISERYILTASHCLKHKKLGLAKLVRIGLTNQSDTNHVQQFTVSEVRYHPEYNHASKYHDIALLKLSKDVELNTYVRPACLQINKDIKYKRAIATGWGNTGYSEEASKDLLKVVLEFFDYQSCNHTYRNKIKKTFSEIKKGILEDIMLCAGSSVDIRDTCWGDSGGPLQVYHNDSDGISCMYDIVGVTSFGKACGLSKNSPGVYTRVSSYLKWIEDIVWPEDLEKSV